MCKTILLHEINPVFATQSDTAYVTRSMMTTISYEYFSRSLRAASTSFFNLV